MKSKVAFVAAGCVIVAALLVELLRDDEPPSPSSASPDATSSRAAQAPETSGSKATAVASASDAAAKRLEATAESTAPADTVERRTLTGRVVDESRFPVAGAAVEVRKDDAIVESASTDAAGRFTVAPALAVLESGVAVIARAGPGRFAAKRWGTKYGTDLGTIVLAPASAMRVLVTRDGVPVGDAAIAVDIGKYREPMFAVRTDSTGRATIDGVPAGFTWVRATHESGMGRKRAFLPDEPEVEIALAPANTFDVRVVEKGSETPVAGAKLTLSETFWIPSQQEADQNWNVGDSITSRPVPELAAVTDADGRARFANLDAEGSFNVSVVAEGFARVPGPPPHSPPRLVASPTPQIIELTPSVRRDVRVPVTAGELPVPAEGTELTVRFAAGGGWNETRTAPGALSMGKGEFVIPAWEGGGGLFAATADAGIASIWIAEDKDVAREASFVKPRAIAVVARDANGRPVAGARAHAYNQGNNPLGEALADADGRAVIRDLLPGLVNVMVSSPGDAGRGTDAGSVDLKSGDGSVECVLPAAVTALLQVRIDGRPALPALFRVGAGMSNARIVDEFPERGELRIAIELATSELGKPLKIGLKGSGELSGAAEFVPTLGGAEPVIQIELIRKSRLDVVVTRPPKTRVKIGIEKRDPATGAFARAASSVPGSISVPNGPANTFRFGGLAEGVYRASDEESKTVSAEVTVPAGANATAAFTVNEIKKVTGTVLSPEGTDRMLMRVIVEAPGLVQSTEWRPAATFPDGVYLNEDGSFEIQIPGDRDVVVRPWHPWLQPAEQGGRLATKDGAAGVVLQLVSGQEVRLPAPDLTAPRFTHTHPRVGYWRGPISGQPERWLAAPLVDGELRFGGLEPGTYSFVVDVMSSFAPLEMADVVVGPGSTQLPAASFKRGAAVRVRILTAAGFNPPRIYVSATRTGQPSYTRSHNSGGEAEVVVQGLGPGEFRITASPIADRKMPIERTLTCDGTNDVTFDLDLR